MNSDQLFDQVKSKKSFLCVGLDAELEKIPPHLLHKDDPIFEFNKAVIDATADLAIAYKPNLAFYEVLGASGWNSLLKTVRYIREKSPEIFIIADAKRGDIGNTARMYAKTFFKSFDFDAITLSPYMGRDSVLPFIEYKEKWVVLLALTSNEGYKDFQLLQDINSNHHLFEEVLEKSSKWGSSNNIMFVVGATHPEFFRKVRRIVPNHFLLVPGVGEQGGSLHEVAKNGINSQCGLIVNSSRGIIYADNTKNFAEAVRKNAKILQEEMHNILIEHMLV